MTVLALLVALCLVACGGQSAAPQNNDAAPNVATTEGVDTAAKEAANAVIKQINAIGNVTVNSEKAITEARAAFNALDGDAQTLVSNMNVLLDAEKTLIALQAAKIDELVNAIGEVSMDKAEAVYAALDAYNNSTPDVQQVITTKAALDAARAEIIKLKAENVDALINAIGKVTLKNESKVTAAQEAFDALRAEEAAAVAGAETLKEAQKTLVELKRDKVLSGLKKSYDKVQGITWYKSSAEPKYANSRSYVLPYIGVQNNNPWLRLCFLYTGDDWVFFTKLTIMVDGQKYYKLYSYYDVERDNGYGDVWEYVDIAPSESDIAMLKAIADSEETIVRFEGDNYHKDITIKDKDKKAIKEILEAYEYLKN